MKHEISVKKSLWLLVTTYHPFFPLTFPSNNNAPAIEIPLYIVNTLPEKRNERYQRKRACWTMMTTSTSEMHKIGMCNIPFIIVVKSVSTFSIDDFAIIEDDSAQMYFHIQNRHIGLSETVLTSKIRILLLDTTYRNVRHMHFFPLILYTYLVDLGKTSTTK